MAPRRVPVPALPPDVAPPRPAGAGGRPGPASEGTRPGSPGHTDLTTVGRCGRCRSPIPADSPTADFCGDICHTAWNRAQATPQPTRTADGVALGLWDKDALRRTAPSPREPRPCPR